jgi:predicted TIM-barrel fold metal-dependent hydrolase
MTEPGITEHSDVTRRRLLTLGAAGAVASGAGVPPALAATEWHPSPHPMAERIFVIDGVAHCYNHADWNRRIPRAANAALDTSYKYHADSTPERYRMTPAQYNRDWQPEEVMDVMFLESNTHMICMHSTPIYDYNWDGLVSNEKGAYLKGKYPDRVLWYGAIDMFDTFENIKAKIDQVAQQGCDGIKFYPTRVNLLTKQPEGWFMDDVKRAYPVFEYLRAKGMRNLATHKLVGYVDGKTPALGINDYYKAAADFPDINFHIVHGGWLLFDETAELMRQRPNVTAVLEGPMLWTIYDKAGFDKMMDVFMRKVDIDRVIYASTSPNQHAYWIVNNFFDYAAPPGAKWKITEEQKAKILGGNLARYHGIDMAARRAKIAADKFSLAVRKNGLREPYIVQRTMA